MASNVYYGICTTAGDTQNKQVQLVNVSSELEGFHLQKGDFLSVYFVNGNEANNVSLTLYIGDINQEYNTSASVDERVYNTGVIGVVPGAWTDGEVVNFSYTHNGSVVENADNNYYWEMVGKPIATSDTYGDVILDGDDPTTAASQNKVEELIDERGIKYLTYISAAEVAQTIGTLRLDTDYPDGTSEEGTPITIAIPLIPTALSQLSNDAGYIINETENNLTFTGSSKQIKVRNNGSDTTIIDLCDSSSEPEPPDVTINSLGNINLNPTGQIVIGSNENNHNLKIYGTINTNGLDILNGENNRLTVDKIKSHTPSPNLITFESPVNIPTGPNTINGLQTDGIKITSGGEPQDLDDYLVDVLGEDDAKAVLDNWLADKLGNYLKTVRIHSQTGPITAGGTFMVELGGGAQHNYTINQQPGDTESESTNANLKLDGYDIVGIIAWETWGSNYACTNICSVYWNNNDPSTGFLKLRVSSSKTIPGTRVSADILYKKQLRTTNTTGE